MTKRVAGLMLGTWISILAGAAVTGVAGAYLNPLVGLLLGWAVMLVTAAIMTVVSRS